LWCVCVCRVRWARPSLLRLLRTLPPSRNPAAASLRNHQPRMAHPCRARQVAAPCRSGVPLAKPFVRPFKLLRCCSRYCSSRGAKRLPAAAAAEGHVTANAFFRPPPGAPSSLRSAAACLPIGADSACAHTTVPLGTVSRHAPVTGVPSLALRCSRSQALPAKRNIFVGDAPPVPAQVSTPTHPDPCSNPTGDGQGACL
jgi:hypothetical protein